MDWTRQGSDTAQMCYYLHAQYLTSLNAGLVSKRLSLDIKMPTAEVWDLRFLQSRAGVPEILTLKSLKSDDSILIERNAPPGQPTFPIGASMICSIVGVQGGMILFIFERFIAFIYCG
jgi:hypothetical protein